MFSYRLLNPTRFSAPPLVFSYRLLPTRFSAPPPLVFSYRLLNPTRFSAPPLVFSYRLLPTRFSAPPPLVFSYRLLNPTRFSAPPPLPSVFLQASKSYKVLCTPPLVFSYRLLNPTRFSAPPPSVFLQASKSFKVLCTPLVFSYRAVLYWFFVSKISLQLVCLIRIHVPSISYILFFVLVRIQPWSWNLYSLWLPNPTLLLAKASRKYKQIPKSCRPVVPKYSHDPPTPPSQQPNSKSCGSTDPI